MTRDDMLAFFARRLEGFNRLDPVMSASLHTEDGILESPFAGGVAEGREAIEQVYRTSSPRSARRSSNRNSW
jgi:hypothetical protein